MMRAFILPALERGRSGPASDERQKALAEELDLASKTPGDPRNSVEAQDKPRL
jgi:hypothetical protein